MREDETELRCVRIVDRSRLEAGDELSEEKDDAPTSEGSDRLSSALCLALFLWRTAEEAYASRPSRWGILTVRLGVLVDGLPAKEAISIYLDQWVVGWFEAGVCL